MDEVDLVMHPLKSELNYPLGRKEPLDLTQSEKLLAGLRWELPLYLLDALFICVEGRVASPMNAVSVPSSFSSSQTTSAFPSISSLVSREADRVLTGLRQVIEAGFAEKSLQKCPHLVILRRSFYHTQMKPWLAQWLLLWLNSLSHEATGGYELTDQQTLGYLLLERGQKSSASMKQRASALGIREECLSDEWLKLLNLARDWLHSLLPFVLGKINRVSFGLLLDSEIDRALSIDPHMPQSRKFTAVPFAGKDVPSPRSEFQVCLSFDHMSLCIFPAAFFLFFLFSAS